MSLKIRKLLKGEVVSETFGLFIMEYYGLMVKANLSDLRTWLD